MDELKRLIFILYSALCLLITLIIVIVLSGYMYLIIYHRIHIKDSIPAHLEIKSVIRIQEDSGLLSGCGGVLFLLSDNTIENIRKNKLSFLNTKLVGRGYENPQDRQAQKKTLYYTYKEWKETPYPSDFNDGMWSGLSCLLKGEKKYSKIIMEAVKKEGAYFTHKYEGTMIIVPKYKILVFFYFG